MTGACKAKAQRDRIGWHCADGFKIKTSVCAHCDTLLYYLAKRGWYHWSDDEQRCRRDDVECFKRECDIAAKDAIIAVLTAQRDDLQMSILELAPVEAGEPA
jgi:hypothetical protein